MSQSEQLIAAFDARAKRRDERRDFFRAALGAAAVGAGAFAFSSRAAAQAGPTTPDVLNFALQLEYLEANFYSYATFGTPIDLGLTTGTGQFGAATGGRAVTFTDPVVRQYAREITEDEINHVRFLRTALGATSATAQPAIDVGITPTGAFSSAARAAGLIGPTSATAPTFFDAYANDENFLLASYIFEDVGVTAYKGSAALITNKDFLEAAAGILAVEAYHAALVRTTLYRKGLQTPSARLIEATEAISGARDSLDGTSDIDQGIAARTVNGATESNIVPLDGDGLPYSRSAAQTLNIVYLNRAAVTMGGFFPNGVNGTIRTSAAN